MKKYWIFICFAILFSMLFLGCKQGRTEKSSDPDRKTLMATYAVLASIVQELAGDSFTVQTLIPNGLDPHEWQPSALDLQAVSLAAVLIQNGLGLEGGMERIVKQAQAQGVKIFTVADHVLVRKLEADAQLPSGRSTNAHVDLADPHLWLDPLTMKTAVKALSDYFKAELGRDFYEKASALQIKLEELDQTIKDKVAALPSENRKLVSGHESLGYFAARYGFEVVGAVVSSLSTQSEVSAADVAAIRKLITNLKVKAIFTELGTPSKVVEALGRETGVKVVRLNTHVLPDDNSYFTFMNNLTDSIVESLK